MTKSSLFTIIVLLGLCSFTAEANLSKQLELQLNYNIFKDWTSKYNKQFGIEEMAVRFMNWKTNLDLVQEHNGKNLEWKLSMNGFADMPSEEFSALHLGLNTDLDAKRKEQKKNENNNKKADTKNHTEPTNEHTKNSSTTLPKSVDWRKEGAVTGVKNQGQCGGCWSFSASGALEGLYAIKNKKLVSFSEQQMIDCSAGYGNNGCDGGLMAAAFEYTHTHGIEPEKGYGYTASVGDCSANSKKVVFKNNGHKEVEANNHLALKHAVAKQPVSVGLEASSMTVQLFKSGVITSNCGTALDHGVLVVGYGAAKNGQEYWIVKNSWGPEWGLDGYMHIAMGSQNKGAGVCGINMMASYPTL